MEGNLSLSVTYSKDDYKQLCIFAFDVLIGTLKKMNHEKLKFPENFKKKTYPLFVTWSSGKDKTLRGCIGTFSPENLEKNLLFYSHYAAFKDGRFQPIKESEVASLHCGVSLLVDFEDGSDAFDWEVGKHGITIDFSSDRKANHHATFLPEIAKEKKWDKKTTLKNLIQKAGFYGKLNEVVDGIKLTRYKSIKVEITYDEYNSYKQKENECEFVIY